VYGASKPWPLVLGIRIPPSWFGTPHATTVPTSVVTSTTAMAAPYLL
jgi:hypothetical protein